MTDVYPMDHVKVKIIIKKSYPMPMACPIFNAQEKESYILKINWIVNTFILNESSKHPKLTLKASSTSSISYSSNRSKYLINFDLSIVLICSHIIIESCSRSSRLSIKTCVGKFLFSSN